MKRGALLTYEQAGHLAGKTLSLEKLGSFVYGIDDNDNVYLPEEVIQDCDREEYLWVKELPIVEYTPKNN
jgi:hypothetical protein